ncbi:MAG: hypothetical protein ACF788_10190, partial [Novipirellula sp. JB048]
IEARSQQQHASPLPPAATSAPSATGSRASGARTEPAAAAGVPLSRAAAAPDLAAATGRRSDATRRLASQLHEIALARSGDKGTAANIGIIARSAEDWPFLQRWLTAPRVEEFLRPLGLETVNRFELENLQALNFVIEGILRDPLRSDAQGKALGQRLLEMPLPAPPTH